MEESTISKDIVRNKNIVSVIAVLMLLLAIPSGIWPYGYYILLRWVVTGIALFILWVAHNLERKGWSWLMIGVAILFNPIVPIHLYKELWQIIDFIVATLFLVSIFHIKRKS